MVELAIVVDAGKQFVQATYNLEGDGPLSFMCYEQLETVYQSIRVRHFPNCAAMISRFGVHVPPNIVQQWNVYAESCVLPGYDYFHDRFHSAVLLQHSKLHVCWCPKKWSFCSLLHLQLRVFNSFLSWIT